MISYDPLSKRMGGYLIDAGLLTSYQVEVALNDQKATGMRFGDIVVERGWVKRRTIEYLSQKVIAVERTLGEPISKGVLQTNFSIRKGRQAAAKQTMTQKQTIQQRAATQSPPARGADPFDWPQAHLRS